jgi:hypothetical protein
MSEKEIYRGTEVKKGNKEVEAHHDYKEGEKVNYRGSSYKAHHEDPKHGHDMKYRGTDYKD